MGGVAMYVKDIIDYQEHTYLQCDEIEAVWIWINFPNAEPLLVVTVYRPESLVEWYDIFDEMLESAYTEDKEIIMQRWICMLTAQQSQ